MSFCLMRQCLPMLLRLASNLSPSRLSLSNLSARITSAHYYGSHVPEYLTVSVACSKTLLGFWVSVELRHKLRD